MSSCAVECVHLVVLSVSDLICVLAVFCVIDSCLSCSYYAISVANNRFFARKQNASCVLPIVWASVRLSLSVRPSVRLSHS